MSKKPPATAEHDDFMDIKAAAKDIGCGERWLRDGVNHGGFPHDRYGKALWFSRKQRDQIRAVYRVPAKPGLMRAYASRTRTKHTRTAVAKPPVPARSSL
jgi:hypothetical protein